MEGKEDPLTQSRLCEGSCELVATKLKSLKIDRVDLVPEGANSAAFVTLYKGKEGKPMELEEILEKMKPEHAEVVKAKIEELNKAKDDAEAARDKAAAKAEEAAAESDDDDEQEDVDKADDKKTEGTTSFDEDETLLKGLSPEVKKMFDSMQSRLTAAEDFAKAAAAREKHAEAVSKATELKALPVSEDSLVSLIEKSGEEVVDMLSAIAKGIESTILSETGLNDSGAFSKSSNNAWQKLEDKAEAIAKEHGVTKARGMSMAMDQYPELYKEYLEGGAN